MKSRFMLVVVALRLLCPTVRPVAGATTPGSAETLQSTAAVRALAPDGPGGFVELEAVVVYYRADVNPDLIVQQDGVGMFVQAGRTEGGPPELRPGDVVTIEGEVMLRGIAPRVRADRISVTGRRELPPAKPVTFEQLLSGGEESQYIEIGGVIRSASFLDIQPPRMILELQTHAGRQSLWVLNFDAADADRLIDAEVRVRGVCLYFTNNRRQAYNRRIVVNDLTAFDIVRPPPEDPWSLPLAEIEQLMEYTSEGMSLHRTRVRGTVSLVGDGKMFYTQDDRAGVQVFCAGETRVTVGDRVEVVAFPSMSEFAGYLEEALVRRLGPGEVREPLEPRPKKLEAGDYDGRLIRLTGALRDRVVRENYHVLEMESEFGPFPALLPLDVPSARLDALRPGSVLDLAGVCATRIIASEALKGRTPKGFDLLLRDEADIAVLRAGPWWTPRRLVAALAVTALVLGAAMLWVATLRRKVALRGQQLAEEIRGRRDAEVGFSARLAERKRVAADLHDTLEQGLTGVALQLQAADLALTREPDSAAGFLSASRRVLDLSREEVRRSIWNLRSERLENRDLAGALRDIGRELTTGSETVFELHVKGDITPLPESVADSLLRVGQEAMANALKHAKPDRVAVTLRFAADRVTLRVDDDGPGPRELAGRGPAEGHFGLQGMRERVKRLGGEFRFESSPTGGARVEAAVPLPRSGPALPDREKDCPPGE